MEEADRNFLQRVEAGFLAVAAREPKRVRTVDGTQSAEEVAQTIWNCVKPLLKGLKIGEAGR
jgi:thymidylate kinase